MIQAARRSRTKRCGGSSSRGAPCLYGATRRSARSGFLSFLNQYGRAIVDRLTRKLAARFRAAMECHHIGVATRRSWPALAGPGGTIAPVLGPPKGRTLTGSQRADTAGVEGVRMARAVRRTARYRIASLDSGGTRWVRVAAIRARRPRLLVLHSPRLIIRPLRAADRRAPATASASTVFPRVWRGRSSCQRLKR